MMGNMDYIMALANDLTIDSIKLRDKLRRFQQEFHPDEERLYQIQFPYLLQLQHL